MIRLETLPDLAAINARAVELFLEAYHASEGPFNVALCGGRTPGGAYALLAGAGLDWNRIHIYWGDERYVPPSDEASNEGLARREFLSKVPIPEGNVHPLYIEGGPALAAATYAESIAGVTFHYCFQGLGSDGHTASIFPGDEASLVNPSLVAATHAPVGVSDRLSLTPAGFKNAKLLVFLVSGEDKRVPLHRFLAGDHLPSRVVAEAGENSVILADLAAYGD